MDYQFLFNPLKITNRMSKPSVTESVAQIEGGRLVKQIYQPMNIKKFQPIVRSKTKGGSLAKSNNIRMIF
jgi:hypothetical protein